MTMLDSTARNSVFRMGVNANWQPDGNSFWYRNNLKGNKREIVYVDVNAGTKKIITDEDTVKLVRPKTEVTTSEL